MRWDIIINLVLQMGNLGTEHSTDLPKVTQEGCDKIWKWTQITEVPFHKLIFLPAVYGSIQSSQSPMLQDRMKLKKGAA